MKKTRDWVVRGAVVIFYATGAQPRIYSRYSL